MRLVLLVLDAQLLDLATFGMAVGRWGIGPESNPTMAGLYAAGGIGAVLGFKAAGAIAASLIAWRLAPSRWALLPAVVGLVGAVTNIMAVV